jgi:hypothetical protein
MSFTSFTLSAFGPIARKRVAAFGVFTALVGAPTLLSGCEFGNKRSQQLTGYDTTSGYYITQPQAIHFDAQVGNGALRSRDGLVAEMPEFLKRVMANPTLFYFDDPVQKLASFRSRENTNLGFFTLFDNFTKSFGASEEIYAVVGGCRYSKKLTTSGTIAPLPAEQLVSDVWARGKASLVYDVTFETEGDDIDCAPVRTAFQDCYVNDVGCSADPQSLFYFGIIDETFTPLINAGVMTANEIGTTKKTAYRAVYQ